VAAIADGAVRAVGAGKLKLAGLAALAACLLGVAGGLRPFPAADAAAGADPAAVTQAQDKAEPAGKDNFDDPLPPGATARLGTLRWRQATPVNFLAITPDGKTILSAGNDRQIRVWDRDTGKEMRRFGPGKIELAMMDAKQAQVAFYRPFALQRHAGVALSPDGKCVALVADTRGTVQLLDVASGKLLKTLPGTAEFGAVALAFSPDGKTLAMGSVDGQAQLWDLDAGKFARDLGPPPPKKRVFAAQNAVFSCALAYSPDGKVLAGAFRDNAVPTKDVMIRFWDPATGKELHTVKVVTRQGFSALAFSPDSQLCAYATVEGEVGLLKTSTGKLLHKWAAGTRQDSPLLVFSADNSKLYTKLAVERAVREWDVKTGKVLRCLGEPLEVRPGFLAGPTGCLTLLADGKTLAVGGDGNVIRFVDLATGKDLPQPGGHAQPVALLMYGADARTLLTRSADHTLRLWDAVTGKQLKQFVLPATAMNFAATPDGRTLALVNERGLTLVDADSGKELAMLGGTEGGIPQILFAPDGRTLAVRWPAEASIILCDVPSGKQRCRVGVGIMSAGGDPQDRVATFFFSPDCKRVLVCSATKWAGVFETATGKLVQKFKFDDGVHSAAFSPDDRTIALVRSSGVVDLLELATGKVRRQFGLLPGQPIAMPAPPVYAGGYRPVPAVLGPPGTATVAFSPDGRLLVHTGRDPEVTVWDVATGKALTKFQGHQGYIGAVAFAPDGRSVASGSSDTTALVWDVQGLSAKAGPAPAMLDADAAKARWADLASDDAAKAGSAINALVAAPQQAVPLLAKHLQSAVAVDVALIEQLIEQLDNGEFKDRQKAQTELLQIGDRVLPYVDKALARQVPLETKLRLESLQAKLAPGGMMGERLQQVRAIEVLERIGNADARKVLQTLADGAPAALTTTHAQAALARLKKAN
jgi:WD40 repeat protein